MCNQIENWRNGKGEFPSDIERHENFLRIRPDGNVGEEVIETGCGHFCTSRDEFQRLFVFARRARKAKEARTTGMRLCFGNRYKVSATHQGDVRVGCQFFHWDELRRTANIIDRRWWRT